MSGFVAELDNVRIGLSSPDSAVRVTVSQQSETRVHISPESREQHDENSLARAVEETVSQAWKAHKAAMDELLRERGLDFSRSAQAATYRGRVHREIEHVRALALSPQGLVKAGVKGRGECRIGFGSNAVRRTDISITTLESEINVAIQRARAAWSRDLMKILRAHRDEK